MLQRMRPNPNTKLTPIPDDVKVTVCPPAECEGSEPLDSTPWPIPTKAQRNENGAE